MSEGQSFSKLEPRGTPKSCCGTSLLGTFYLAYNLSTLFAGTYPSRPSISLTKKYPFDSSIIIILTPAFTESSCAREASKSHSRRPLGENSWLFKEEGEADWERRGMAGVAGRGGLEIGPTDSDRCDFKES